MNYFHKIQKGIVAIIFATMLFACQGKLSEVRQWQLQSDSPQAVGKEINLFYTENGEVKAHLISPLMYDFSNQAFQFREFPKGLNLEFFDENNAKSTVAADYAIIYGPTGIVDLRGNVKVVMPDSTVLLAKQLYWDQNAKWVFTDMPYKIKLAEGGFNQGQGFDSNQGFDHFSSRANVGLQVIEENKVEVETTN